IWPALDGTFKRMHNPALPIRVAREYEGKFRVELDCPGVKVLGLLQRLKAFERSANKIVRLDKSEVGVAVLRGFAFDARFLRRRQLGLERIADILGEIGLNGENVS